MSGLSINGRHIAVQGVKELDPNLSIQEAAAKTNKNGIDEVYFTSGGKNYIAYGDKLDLKALKKGDIPNITLDGKQANLVTFEDEANSILNGVGSGALGGLKTTRDVVTSAVSSTMRSSGTTSMIAVGGALGLTGYAVVKGVTISSGSPIANILDDVLVHGSLKAAKGIAITAAAGLVLAVGTGAVVGAADAVSTEKNYSSIASVTKEGNYKPNPPAPPTDPANPPASNTPPSQPPSNTPADNKSSDTASPKLAVLPSGVSIGKPIKRN